MLIYLLVKGSPCSDLSKTCRVVDKSNTTILNHERSQICINSCVPNAHKFVSLRAYQTLTNSYQFVYTNHRAIHNMETQHTSIGATIYKVLSKSTFCIVVRYSHSLTFCCLFNVVVHRNK